MTELRALILDHIANVTDIVTTMRSKAEETETEPPPRRGPIGKGFMGSSPKLAGQASGSGGSGLPKIKLDFAPSQGGSIRQAEVDVDASPCSSPERSPFSH